MAPNLHRRDRAQIEVADGFDGDLDEAVEVREIELRQATSMQRVWCQAYQVKIDNFDAAAERAVGHSA